MVSPCFSFGVPLDSSEVGVRILWKGETRGGGFLYDHGRSHNSVMKAADYPRVRTIFMRHTNSLLVHTLSCILESVTFPSF